MGLGEPFNASFPHQRQTVSQSHLNTRLRVAKLSRLAAVFLDL
jgi:hypothetical protein